MEVVGFGKHVASETDPSVVLLRIEDSAGTFGNVVVSANMEHSLLEYLTERLRQQ